MIFGETKLVEDGVDRECGIGKRAVDVQAMDARKVGVCLSFL